MYQCINQSINQLTYQFIRILPLLKANSSSFGVCTSTTASVPIIVQASSKVCKDR